MLYFDVNVKTVVTYYWQLAYNTRLRSWIPVGSVSQDQAINGGPTYNVPLTVQTAIRTIGDVPGASEGIGSVLASYYNSTNEGCPGLAYLRTRFSLGNGFPYEYRLFSRDTEIMRGLVRRGNAEDEYETDLPPGGNPEACSGINIGILGGNT
jgi:hypothetical protein